jgi:hypothetical protein
MSLEQGILLERHIQMFKQAHLSILSIYVVRLSNSREPLPSSAKGSYVSSRLLKLLLPLMPLSFLGDDDAERRTQGEVLLNAYNRELERRRLAAGARGVTLADEGMIKGRIIAIADTMCVSENEGYDDDDDSGDEFHYPGASPSETPRPSSSHTQGPDYFSQTPAIRAPDLTPALSQASEFRVPTHEAPQKVLTPRWTAPSPHQLHAQWERDINVSACRVASTSSSAE